MLDKSDIKKLSGVFATKAELKKFATKADLKKFATKADLKKFATKADLKKFATKDEHTELKEIVQKLDERTIRIAEKVSAINERMDTFLTKDEFNTRIDAVVTGIDAIAGGMSDLRMEYIAIKTIQNRHEDRIVRLEQKTGVVFSA